MSDAAPTLLRAWLTVALLWFVGCLNYLDRVMITTMRGSLVDAIPMTDAQFGLLTTVFLLVYAVLSPFAGYLADRFNRTRVIVISLVVWSLVTWATAGVTTYGQLLATRALMGVSEACYIPAALALIADYHGPGTRSLANGVHLSGVMVGAGLGGVGGWIAERHGWTQAFVWFGQVGVVLAIVVAIYLRDRAIESTAENATAAEPVRLSEACRSLFQRREFLLALGYWGLLGLSVWSVVGWMPSYLREQFGLTQGAAGLSATGYYQGASLIGVILGGLWADRWSRTRPHAPMLVPLIGLCVAAPAILLAASTSTLPLALAGLALFGLTKAFADANMMPILTLISDRRYRATGYGVLNLCACIVGGATIYAGGALRDAAVNVSTVFQFGAASVVVCAGLLFLLLPRRAAARTVPA
jgi:MFS family permease